MADAELAAILQLPTANEHIEYQVVHPAQHYRPLAAEELLYTIKATKIAATGLEGKGQQPCI